MRIHHIKLTALLVIMTTMLSGCAGSAGGNGNNAPARPASAIIVTVAPTEKLVEITPTSIPTTLTPDPTPTLEPTTTPELTSTSVPTVAVSPEATLLDSVKMGDNVWYDIYDNSTLVVRGTGKTMDFENGLTMSRYLETQCDLQGKYLMDYAITVIVEEGITEIGKSALSDLYYTTKVIFPTSLKKLNEDSFSGVGYMADNTDYIGLDANKVDIESTAFSYCGSPENLPDSEKYTTEPTAAPLQTVTPLPDPNNPKKYATKQMGDNVAFEFYDNGYLYVKGTGATWDKSYVSFLDFRNEPYCNTHTVIIEEGITYLGTSVFNELNNVSRYSLPKSLTTISNDTRGYNGNGTTIIEGYYDGKAVTLKIAGTGNPGQFHSIIENAEVYAEYYPGMFEVLFE